MGYKKNNGFTLIELLVVVAIIALLSSIIMIGVLSARQKSRDAKRLSDMTQMMNALELYNAAYKGYPTSTNGVPTPVKQFAATIPLAPNPADGSCDAVNGSTGTFANTYYYLPVGTAVDSGGGVMVFPDYKYYFCLGNDTGNFKAGQRYITPTGIK